MKTYVVGNWKMHFDINQSSVYLHKICRRLTARRGVAVAVAPSFMALQPLALQMARHQHQGVYLCAQNVATKDEGAYTGEVSAQQLRGVVQYCIVGHSERRKYQQETNEQIREKIIHLLKEKITPILCIGESQDERKQQLEQQVITKQLEEATTNLSEEDKKKIIIAYEPIWSIGTGVIPTNEEIESMVNTIKQHFPSNKVLYGGSANVENIDIIKQVSNIDGYLLGGLSLHPEQLQIFLEKLKN